MSAPHQRYIHFERIQGVLLILIGFICFFLPNEIIALINIFPNVFHLSRPLPEAQHFFWLAPACVLLVTLGLLNLASAQSPKVRSIPLLILTAEVLTASGYAYLFFEVERYFAYFFGLVAMSLLALIQLWLFLWVRQEREPAREEPHQDSPVKKNSSTSG